MRIKKIRITPDVDAFKLNLALSYIYDLLESLPFYFGKGDPNGRVVASPGSLYLNQEGGANVTLWVKESGENTLTGWVAK